jgi:primosomal protein N' (replication factor Y)
MRSEFQNRFHRGAISRPLEQAIGESLQQGGQIILLLNRRGFATHIQCPSCGEVVRCRDCDIALTHHREANQAVCHYCDYQIPAPPTCPACGFEGIRYGGVGTQRVEAEIRARFPHAVCLRMDSDTMRKPGSHEQALTRFRRGEVQILLGTQMIAKGLDFPGVTLVGVVNADIGLHLPDFRATERTFQLVMQVAGRTGRGEHAGRVLVQTFNPEHIAIVAAIRHDFHRLAQFELKSRREFGYPPFGVLVRLVFRGPVEAVARQAAAQVVQAIRDHLGGAAEVRVLGPAAAPIAKLRGQFRFHALLQGQDRELLQHAVRSAQEHVGVSQDAQWIVDVDPLDML